jgi:hypothetical protein
VVYLVLTRAGFDEVRPRLQPADVVWTGRSVLPAKEIDALRGQGVDLTVFPHEMDPTDSSAAAGWTLRVAQRHPGQPIWVEQMDRVVAEGRRKEQRSFQRWIYPVLLVILVLVVGVLGVYVAPYFDQLAAWASRMSLR